MAREKSRHPRLGGMLPASDPLGWFSAFRSERAGSAIV